MTDGKQARFGEPLLRLLVLTALLTQTSAAASAADNIGSLTNPSFQTTWTYRSGGAPYPPSGWTILDWSATAGGPIWVGTGDNCSDDRPSDHRCKYEFAGSGGGGDNVIAKEVNWGSAGRVIVKAFRARHSWNGGTGSAYLGVKSAGGAMQWSQRDLTATNTGGECEWRQLSLTITRPLGATTFTVMLNGHPNANGNWNCQFDDLQIIVDCAAPSTPGAPAVGGATAATLELANNASDSGTAYYAFRINGGGFSNQFVQANGSVGASPVWRTKSAWGTVTVSGLAADTTYTFSTVAATDSAGNCPSAFGPIATGATTPLCVVPDTGLSVGATANPITVGESTSVTVAGSQIGVNYQLRKNSDNSSVGGPVAGTGGTISLPTGALSATTAYNVLATRVSGGCSAQLSQIVTITVAIPAPTIAQAKSCADGTIVQIRDKPVSGATASAYWIEETDRSSGIKVVSTSAPVSGTRMTVTGTLATTAGERRLQQVFETQGLPGVGPAPIHVPVRAIGGCALNVHTPGVTSPFGPNNIGLLVQTWGRVTAASSGQYYYVDDGSAIRDGTTTGGSPNIGVRVLADPGPLRVNDPVTVTGVSSSFLNSSSQIQRAILPVVVGCVPPNGGLAVGAAASAVCSGQSTTVTVASSEPAVTYQLRRSPDNSNVGGPVVGTGGTIALPTGTLATTTTFNVLATRAVGGCSTQLTQTKTVTVYPLPNTNLAVGATASTIWAGQTCAVTIAGSQVGVVYQLRNNADNSSVGLPIAGTGGAINLSANTLAATTTFNVLATNTTTGCSAQLAQTRTITVNARSKVGLHIVIGSRTGYGALLTQTTGCGKPVAVVKCVDDMAPAAEAKSYSAGTFTVGRYCTVNGWDLGGLDGWLGGTPQAAANTIYPHLKALWQQHPEIDAWEMCNEWDAHYDWQADFYIAMMDKAEADGFRLALWSSSGGTPGTANYYDVNRACQRAKAHGGHILCLHEYGFWPPPGQKYALLMNAGPSLVTRYRQLYAYLRDHGGDIPLVISECGQEGGYRFVGTDLFIQDYTWYDQQLQQDSYVIGCAAWTLGNWGDGVNFEAALPALANYLCAH